MSLLTRAVTVHADAPTQLNSETTDLDGVSLAFYNNDASLTMYLGGADVTTANGVPIPPKSWSPGMDLRNGELAYARVASGTAEARVLEVGIG